MATKDRRKLQHIHSSIADKQPTPQSLEVGEIAVNNASVSGKSKSFLSIKNSENKIDRFSSDSTIIDWIEKKEVMPYSGVVDNVHLDTNRSNIEIKINQVAAKNTPKYNLINGAVDIDGNPVNPSTDGGKTDGAGISIDMSQYAMIGANPSFSSVTVTNKTDLGGNTTINGDLIVTGNTTLAATTATSISASTEVKSPSISGTGVSADTFYGKMSKKLTWSGGTFTADTTDGYNGSVDRTITVPTELSHLTYKTLEVKNQSGDTIGTYDPGATSSQTITIPTGGGGGTSPLTINYGNIYTGTTGTSYDTTAPTTITVPNSLSGVSNGNVVDSSPSNTTGKITINKNIEVSGTVTATGAIYSSDRNLKENIFDISENEFERVGFVKYKTYNFKGEDNKMYGVIAQDLQDAGLGEIVYSKDDGTLAVDYTSLMILQLARLKRDNENMLTHIAWLERRIEKLEGNNNE